MKDVTPKKRAEPAKATVQKGNDPHPKKAAAPPAPPAKPKPKKTGTAVAVDDPKKRRQIAQHEAAGTSNLPALLLEAARDKNVDAEKAKAMFDLYKEVQAHEAKSSFDDAFVALQSELPSIRRDGKIEIKAKDAKGERTGPTQQSTPYATFNAIHEAIKPLLVKYGFGLSFSTAPTADGRITVKTTLSRKGHSISSEFPLPAETSGSKNNVQGWGSSQSYGKRYGTIALLNIVSHAPEDRDTDGHENRATLKDAKGGKLVEVFPGDTLSKAQVSEIEIVMDDCGVSAANFCTRYGIAAVADLPADLFGAAKKALQDHKAGKAENRRG